MNTTTTSFVLELKKEDRKAVPVERNMYDCVPACVYLCILQLRLCSRKVFAGFDVLTLGFAQEAVYIF